MKIGLLRHFPVNYKYSFATDALGFENELANYDKASIKPFQPKKVLSSWDICYASTLRRAQETARYLYKGKIITTDLLREVPLKAVFKKRVLLPLVFWFLLARCAWFINNHTQTEPRFLTIKRAEQFLFNYCLCQPSQKRILVVSHGFFMLNLQRLLRNYGFKGKSFSYVHHARLYVFTKE